MKITITKVFMAMLALPLFAFTPAQTSNFQYSNVVEDYEVNEQEFSSFEQTEESVYTPSKGTFTRRVRIWTELEAVNATQSAIETIISRN